MNKKSAAITVIAVILSFVGGFLLANAVNRSELTSLRTENDRLKSTDGDSTNSELTVDEIDQKVAEADSKPDDQNYQRTLGLALYRYGSMKQNTDILTRSARLLERASTLKKDDRDAVVGLGNAYFDIGYFAKDNESLKKARVAYERALALKGDDASVISDLALTYFLEDPPDLSTAEELFHKALKIDPKHERALQFLVQTLVKEGKKTDAARYLSELKLVNSSNDAIPELSSMVADSESPGNK
ncbi:MAG: tetratricopeptide repeat protein [Acidobacteriota bacterium]